MSNMHKRAAQLPRVFGCQQQPHESYRHRHRLPRAATDYYAKIREEAPNIAEPPTIKLPSIQRLLTYEVQLQGPPGTVRAAHLGTAEYTVAVHGSDHGSPQDKPEALRGRTQMMTPSKILAGGPAYNHILH